MATDVEGGYGRWTSCCRFAHNELVSIIWRTECDDFEGGHIVTGLSWVGVAIMIHVGTTGVAAVGTVAPRFPVNEMAHFVTSCSIFLFPAA